MMDYQKIESHIKTLREWVAASKRLDKTAERNSTLRKRTGRRGGLATTLSARHDLAAKEVWDLQTKASSEASNIWMRPVDGDKIGVPITLFVDLVNHLDGCSHGYPEELYFDGKKIIDEELELDDGLYYLKARAKQQPLTTGMGATPVSPAPTQTPLVDKMES